MQQQQQNNSNFQQQSMVDPNLLNHSIPPPQQTLLPNPMQSLLPQPPLPLLNPQMFSSQISQMPQHNYYSQNMQMLSQNPMMNQPNLGNIPLDPTNLDLLRLFS